MMLCPIITTPAAHGHDGRTSGPVTVARAFGTARRRLPGTVAEYRCGPSTLAPGPKVLKRTMVQHAITYFPDETQLIDMAALAIQEFIKSLTDAGSASRTVRAAFDTLHQALDTATQWDLLIQNPADRAGPSLTQASSEITTEGDRPSPNTLQDCLGSCRPRCTGCPFG